MCKFLEKIMNLFRGRSKSEAKEEPEQQQQEPQPKADQPQADKPEEIPQK